jgi:predicted transcriptional regulator YdeE
MSTITTKVEQRNEVKIIAKKCVGLHNIFEGSFLKDNSIELANKAEEIPNWINRSVHYGIAPISRLQDNPETHTYYIGVEVRDFNLVPDGYECLTIPSGKYAVIHKSPTMKPGDAYGVWKEEWIKSDEGYTLECFYESIRDYSERINGENNNFEMDLCIALN